VIETFTAHWQEIAAWVRDGTVTDVKTIIGIAWLEKWLDGKWRT
jgi:ADP-ribose pyrophosphatase